MNIRLSTIEISIFQANHVRDGDGNCGDGDGDGDGSEHHYLDGQMLGNTFPGLPIAYLLPNTPPVHRR